MIFKHFDSANLRLRVISAVILMPVVLLAVSRGGLAYGAVIICAAVIGFFEWLRLVSPSMHVRSIGFSCALLSAVLSIGFFFSLSYGVVAACLAMLALYIMAKGSGDKEAHWTALGVPYLAGSGLALLYLRSLPDIGAALVFYLLIVVWSTDSGAFIAGRLIGGPKLAPTISPSKTWAGLLGGMTLALALGYLTARFMGAQQPLYAAILAPLLAIVAQMGDLFESAFKRRSGAKESGDLIPGHGGVLDRVDGLVFASLFLAFFQFSLGARLAWW